MVAFDSALDGLGRAQTAFDQAASEIADPLSATPPGAIQDARDQVSLSDTAVAMLRAGNDFEANLKSLQVAGDMQKSLLNLLA